MQEEFYTFGQYFQELRIKSGLNLKDVNQRTKIGVTILKRLENDQYEDLPDLTYVKGFVKSLMKLFKGDLEKATKLINKSYNIDQKSLVFDKVIPEEKEKIPFIKILYIIPFVIPFFLIDFNNNKKLNLVPEKKSKKINFSINYKDSISQIINSFGLQSKAILSPSLNGEEKITFSPLNFHLYDISSKVPELSEKEIDFFNTTKDNAIILRTKSGKSWATYEVDSNKIKTDLISPESPLFLNGKVLKFFIGNVNDIELIYNSKLLEINSSTGVKSLIIPKEMASNFKIPLFIFQKDGKIISSEEYLRNN